MQFWLLPIDFANLEHTRFSGFKTIIDLLITQCGYSMMAWRFSLHPRWSGRNFRLQSPLGRRELSPVPTLPAAQSPKPEERRSKTTQGTSKYRHSCCLNLRFPFLRRLVCHHSLQPRSPCQQFTTLLKKFGIFILNFDDFVVIKAMFTDNQS